MKLSKIYTKTGDNGTTSLVGGIRINKDSVRLEAYGTIDELSSHIGMLVSLLETNNHTSIPETIETLENIQCKLFNIGTYLATDTSQTPIYESAKLYPEEITFIEKHIDEITANLPEINSFILPGGNIAASQCHICRTVCRRAERCIIALSNETEISNHIIRYVNRLSDYFFVLARNINILFNTKEKIWQKTCK